ncbi:MAG: hypothetical protein IK048_04940 [Clostridia bacterium]|nr:hypothetical protein [Clostridia bacterium]
MSGRKGGRYFVLILAIFVILSSCLFMTACNKQSVEGDIEYSLYIRRTYYHKESQTMTVYLSLSNDERMTIEGTSANWHYKKRDLDAFYYCYDYTVTFSPSTIFSVVENSLTQEQRIIDGTEYNNLKVVLEYATIYKSVEGSEKVVKSDGYYLHDFPFEETDESFQATLTRRIYNAAVWYGVLVAAAVAVFGMILAIVLLRRKKYANERQERTESE